MSNIFSDLEKIAKYNKIIIEYSGDYLQQYSIYTQSRNDIQKTIPVVDNNIDSIY